MKIIFLDIDGVLCTYRSLSIALARYHGIPIETLEWSDQSICRSVKHAQAKCRSNNHPTPSFNCEYWPFDEKAVDLIHRLLREDNDIKIVISSTWRIGYTLLELHDLLKLKGLCAPIFGKTPELPGGNRASEIKAWLAENSTIYDISSFCIIDDSVRDIVIEYPEQTVQTWYGDGFSSAQFDKVKEILL